LSRRPEATVVLIGHGAFEVEYCRSYSWGERVVDLSGTLTLPETIRLLAHADLVVSNDTAPLHFALTTPVPVVALFGPTQSAMYVPPGRARTLTASVPLYCSPCVHYWEPPPCNGDNQCMKRLTVHDVLSLCCTLLDLAPPPPDPVKALPLSRYYPGLVYTRVTAGPYLDGSEHASNTRQPH
jgi:ADP-heptose:LPS heptosyltransferase